MRRIIQRWIGQGRVLALLLVCMACARASDTPISFLDKTASLDKTAGDNLFFLLDLCGIPFQIRARDLTPAWRGFFYTSPVSNNAPRMSHDDYGQSRAKPGTRYYTRGDTVALGGETYIVVYGVRPGQNPPDWTRRMPENLELSLTLLNAANVSSLHDFEAFDAKRDLLAQGELDASIPIDNLHVIGLALQQYTQDYDEKLPPMRAAKTEAQVRAPWNGARPTPTVFQVLAPYVRDTDVFVHPKTREPFKPNPNLSFQHITAFNFPDRIVAFYEASPAKDGKRAILFLDGHVERMTEDRWRRYALGSRIPP